MNSKRQIIFVDDETYALQGYKRALEPYANDWNVYFFSTAPEALTFMSQNKVDVLITDLRMPGMDGIALLEQAIQHFPSVIRMILSGHIEEPSAYRAASLAHQLIAKPCEINSIRNSVEETCHLRDTLSDKKLVKLVTGIQNLPSVPILYLSLLKEFQSEQPTMSKVAEIISMDVAMTAKILQLVNSAFFSIPYKISNLNQALSILGLNTIKALVLSVGVFSQYQNRVYSTFSIDDLWQHSIFVGNLSGAIAASVNLTRAEQDEAQMAGILHDVGKLIQTDVPGLHRLLSMNTKIPEIQMEYHYLGASHAEIGAYMLSLWGLPSGVIKAVAFHHNPAKETSYRVDSVSAVNIANCLYYSENPQAGKRNVQILLDKPYLERIKAEKMLDEWKDMARRVFKGERP